MEGSTKEQKTFLQFRLPKDTLGISIVRRSENPFSACFHVKTVFNRLSRVKSAGILVFIQQNCHFAVRFRTALFIELSGCSDTAFSIF